MAKVTITLVDENDKGTITVKIESDPGFPGPAAPPEEQSVTVAQSLGLQLMEHLNNIIKGQGDNHDNEPEPAIVER
jgi:hypothetical protein